MFGYVKVAQDDLRVREMKLYRQYYCGLCRQMANYSQAARLMLSYDMVFLALLIEASLPPETKPCKKKCFRYCRKICGDVKLNYIAAISTILQYFKLQNDYMDGDKKKKFLMAAIEKGYKLAAKDYPEVNSKIAVSMEKLYKLESSRCNDLKELEKCFASIFYDVFLFAPVGDEYISTKAEIAYHVGAWVYWFDMLNDVEEDRQSGNFNAILLQKFPSNAEAEVRNLCLDHLGIAETLVELLPYNDRIAIIQNVVCLGLPLQMDTSSCENCSVKLNSVKV